MLLDNLHNLVFSLLVFGIVGVLAGAVISMLRDLDFKIHLMISVPALLFSLLTTIVSLILIIVSREQSMWYWNFLNFGLSAFLYYLVSLITTWICKKVWSMF